MKIVAVRTHRLRLLLREPFVTALRSTTEIDTLIVEIESDDGVRGFGECPQVWQVTGESVVGAEACVTGPLRSRLLGADPADTVELLRSIRQAVAGNGGAKAAIDVAVHDLVARAAGLPLVQLLGGRQREIRTDASLSVGDPATMAASATERIHAGFRSLKLKVGSRSDDIETVLAVRRAVGPDVHIRIDANQGWTVGESIRTIRALEDAGADIEFVEQPIIAHDYSGLARVSAAVDTPVMADESIYRVPDLIELIRRSAVDLINVKLAKCGGLAVGKTLLECAREAGIGTMVGSMMESAVGVSAAACLAAAVGTTVIADLDAAWWLRQPVDGLTYDSGILRLSDRPGLGIEDITDLYPQPQ